MPCIWSSPISAARSSLAPRGSCRPAPSIGRARRINSFGLEVALPRIADYELGMSDPNLRASASFPAPQVVALAMLDEARSGALALIVGVTLARVAAAFIIAMALGSALGLIMGHSRVSDRLFFGDPWLIVLLNLPALVIIVLAYIWAGLTEIAAVSAVALNKLPIATVTVREGARSLDTALDEMAQVFRMRAWTRIRHIMLASACALSRRRCPLGPVAGLENCAHRGAPRPTQWSRFRDRGGLPAVRRHAEFLAYAFAFVAVMLAVSKRFWFNRLNEHHRPLASAVPA